MLNKVEKHGLRQVAKTAQRAEAETQTETKI